MLFLIVLQTANLDGETNLKIRKALEKTWDYVIPEKVSEFKGFSYFIIIVIVIVILNGRQHMHTKGFEPST